MDKNKLEQIQIDNKLFPIKPGESVSERLKLSDKLIGGYNQFYPIERALGFKSSYELQGKLHGVRHLINASDVEASVRWLLNNGFDIIKK